MQFSRTLCAVASLATAVAAGSVHFVNQDSLERTIYFTASEGLQAIPNLVIAGSATAVQEFPTAWIGNWYASVKGASNTPGMLGEVRFDGYAGATYFDVSAIVDPDDHQGVKMLFPKNSNTPVSGCQTFPCSNAYNQPDDIATLSTDDTELVCLLGTLSNTRRRGHVARHIHSLIES